MGASRNHGELTAACVALVTRDCARNYPLTSATHASNHWGHTLNGSKSSRAQKQIDRCGAAVYDTGSSFVQPQQSLVCQRLLVDWKGVTVAETPVTEQIDDDLVIPAPDVSHLVTEDDTPVDNIFSERQMALLRETLYTSWEGPGEGRPFVAMGNVALYATNFLTLLAPDLLLSLDVSLPA